MNNDDECLLNGFKSLPNQSMKSMMYLLKNIQQRLDKLHLPRNVDKSDQQETEDDDVDDLLDYSKELEEELCRALAKQTCQLRELKRELSKTAELHKKITQRFNTLLNGCITQNH